MGPENVEFVSAVFNRNSAVHCIHNYRVKEVYVSELCRIEFCGDDIMLLVAGNICAYILYRRFLCHHYRKMELHA